MLVKCIVCGKKFYPSIVTSLTCSTNTCDRCIILSNYRFVASNFHSNFQQRCSNQQQQQPKGGSTNVTPQAQIRIWWDPPVGAYRLTSPFNRSLVDALKAQIPASDRLYDPTTKIWTFSEKWLTPTVNLIKLTTGATATVISRQQVENASQSQSSTTGSTGSNNQVATSSRATLDTVMITFVKNLPYEAALAAYRKAAMLCHPDRGGSMEQMSQLNATWQRLEKELWKQS